VEDLKLLDKSVLMDMLAKNTTEYMAIYTDGGDHDKFAICDLTIKAIQRELENRKMKDKNPGLTNSHIPFTKED